MTEWLVFYSLQANTLFYTRDGGTTEKLYYECGGHYARDAGSYALAYS